MDRILIPKRSLYMFGVWLILGVLIGFAALWSFTTLTKTAQAKPDASKFDPDVHPVLEVSHRPVVILRSDETAHLEFLFACGYFNGPGSCHPTATLFTAWGDGPFNSTVLDYTDLATIDMPATDSNGKPLRYYVELQDPQAGTNARYPTVGFIEPTVVSSFVKVNTPAPEQVTPEVVLQLPWGKGDGQVGRAIGSEGPSFGPDAIDIGPNGTIAILDEVNNRVILADPKHGKMSNFPATLSGVGDVAIAATGQIFVLNSAIEPDSSVNTNITHLYRFGPNGKLQAKVPIFAELPSMIMGTRSVFDGEDNRTVTPMDDQGHARSREEQRASRAKPELRIDLADATHARLADEAGGRVFEVSADADLGLIPLFERAAGDYVVVFQVSDGFRVLRFDHAGTVLRNVSVAATGVEGANPGGQVAVGPDGSVYILTSTPTGIEILRVEGLP